MADAREVFRAGKNRDGYFTNVEVVAQLKRAMALVKEHYPDEDHVFVYDNAKTHTARAPNALSASAMTLNPSANFGCKSKNSAEKVSMRDACFADGTPQPLYFPAGHPSAGQFKGMKVLILERIARGCSLPNPVHLKAQCTNFKCPPGRTDCCCRRVLYTQPDFVKQASMLEDVATSEGFKVLFLPKFHCELNFIEQVWGYAKRVYREFPASSSEEDLERNAIEALDSIPLLSMRR
jgi:hypothetical protein